MPAKENRALIEQWYQALASGDWQTVTDLHADDVVYQMLGSTPVSGTLIGKEQCIGEMINKKLLGQLDTNAMAFAKKWRIMCVDDNGGVGIMQGGGPTLNGDAYDQTYCEVFTIKKGKIVELHAFFDTALVERCLFQNPLKTERESPQVPFDF
jgi:ketosteroid isomerase-like protein|tara:strand:+ start:99 stop:557 length:459 start_codon:yes stop_codon:yes gene_type:complete